ncbi:nucleotide-binding site protein [Artemisia annua]|uniref:Nucleotide-binding site protein n=1 Tax=Artemisia annua TaxID=35608 RepID=A0A2U1ML58_ARTAN|nr:nucleotide-binding site protein [Artemisia annua]
MASTPSSSSTQLWNYDVYLSFRYEVRKKFVDHLYTALQQRGILTYVDNEDLSRGAPMDVTLLKAIQESRIAIVVFSIHYADSLWCLTELTSIIKCRDERGQIVIPIYYHVDPSEVRQQKGEFGYVFSKQALENIPKAESWRKALIDASDIVGWEVGDNPNIPESRCIQQVVDTVSNRLLPARDLNGIGTHLLDLKIGGGDSLMASSHPSNCTAASSYKLGNHNVFLSFQREDTAC